MAIRLHEAYDAADQILNCVCAALEEAQTQDPAMPGCPCRAFVAPGSVPAWDCSDGDCNSECSGQLTVNLRDLSESTQFPSTGGTRSAPRLPPGCVPPHYVVAEFAVTLLRCIPVGYEDGTPPSPADMAQAARVTLADAAVVYDALQCCLTGLVSQAGRPLKYQLGRARVLPAQGGCTGVEAPVSVYFPSCDCPETGVIPDAAAVTA